MTPAAIGPYVISRPLATGGMAELFVAERKGPHGFSKRVALKRILPQYVSDPDFKSMFIDEAKLAARMSHPGVVQVFDFGEHEGELFLAMELVEGSNVNRLIRAAQHHDQTIPLEVALHIAGRTAQALAYAHRVGADGEGGTFVHRDVSPANILLTSTGHVKLTDFGIAKMSNQSRHTEDGHVRGKLGYMSPEQVLGRTLDGKSDVFALTTVFAEMLIGVPLFGLGSELDILVNIRDADLSRLTESSARIPRDVLSLLEHGLAKDPKERPSAAAFADACEEVLRRRAMAHGPERTARLLARLHLAEGVINDNSTDHTTSLIDTKGLGTEAASLLKDVDGATPDVYCVRLDDGAERGPMSYPRLVQMITGGQVTSATQISKAGVGYMPAAQWPELTRFVTSPAISWRPGETADASRRGVLTPGSMVPMVHDIFRARETGVLHLWSGDRRKKIYFVDGRPDFVASTDRHELLGEHLVASGYCLRMEVEMGLALMPRYGGRLGDALVGLELLRPVDLFRAISSQVRSRLLEAFQWRTGEWAFVDGARSHEDTFLIGETGFPLLRDAVMQMRSVEIEANLSEVWEHILERRSILEERAHAFNLPPAWLKILQQADQTTVSALLANLPGDEHGDLDMAYRALFLGIRCGLVNARSASTAPSS